MRLTAVALTRLFRESVRRRPRPIQDGARRLRGPAQVADLRVGRSWCHRSAVRSLETDSRNSRVNATAVSDYRDSSFSALSQSSASSMLRPDGGGIT